MIDYSMELFEEHFTVQETIEFKVLKDVHECFFQGGKFDVSSVEAYEITMKEDEKIITTIDSILSARPQGVFSLMRPKNQLWAKDVAYGVTFHAKKNFAKVGEGFMFKVYREKSTFKRLERKARAVIETL